ncbi:MAG: hypothetical protein LBP92_01540 [Deltaproteobacteria bacterium]|jgi:hypothetical protein|nr:hypothetical protein [Deltaproteobacteria bacterium]
MDKERQLPLRLAREICLRLVERRVLSAVRLPGALAEVGSVAASLSAGNGPHRVLASAGDLVLRLIERGRLGTPQAASEALMELNSTLLAIAAGLPAHKAGTALRSAVDLALKLLETNSSGPEPLGRTLALLAEASADLLPDPSFPPVQPAKRNR